MKKNYSVYFIFVISISILLLSEMYLFDYTVDDFYVGVRYAENLANGNGLVYNNGERLEGYSTFLWIIILALFIKLNIDVVIAAKAIGILFSILNLFVIYKIGTLITKERIYSLIPIILLSLTPAYALWGVGALETQLFIFSILIAIYFFIYEETANCKIYFSSIFFAFSALVRHEGALIFVICFAYRFIFVAIKQGINKEVLKRFFVWGLLFCIIYLPFFIWRILYFGHIFPTAFFAKNSNFEAGLIIVSYGHLLPSFVQNSNILMKMLVYTGRLHFQLPLILYSLPLLYLWAVTYVKSKHNKIKRRGYNYLLVFIISIIIIGLQFYDWMPGHRYLLAAIPLLYLLCIDSIKLMHKSSKKERGIYKVYLVLLLIFLLAFNFNMLISIKKYTDNYTKDMEGYTQSSYWLRNNAPKNSTLALQNAGIIPYFSKLPIIHIHQMPVLNKDIVYNSTLTYDYIFNKKPDIILLFGEKSAQDKNQQPKLAAFYKKLYDDKRFSDNYEYTAHFCWGQKTEIWLFKRKNVNMQTFNSKECIDFTNNQFK